MLGFDNKKISIGISLLLLLSSCGNTEIIEESTGSVSETIENTQIDQETADRLVALENERIQRELEIERAQQELIKAEAIKEAARIEEEERILELEKQIAEDVMRQEEELQKALAAAQEALEEAAKSTRYVQPTVQDSPATQVSGEDTTPESVTDESVTEPIVNMPVTESELVEITIETEEEENENQEILPVEVLPPEEVPEKESNIVVKIIKAVTDTVKAVVKKVKETILPPQESQGDIEDTVDLPLNTVDTPGTPEVNESEPIDVSDIPESDFSGSGVINPIPEDIDSPINTTQSGGIILPISGTGVITDTGTGGITDTGNLPVLEIETPLGDTDTSLTDIETGIEQPEIAVNARDENIGIAQFSQGNFTGLDTSNPINLTTESGIPVILYNFKPDDTLSSPTFIVGKIQKRFVFDGLFSIQVYDGDDKKVKDWYATTFFSEDEGDIDSGMLFFLIELVYDSSSVETDTGKLKFVTDVIEDPSLIKDFLDIPVQF